MWRLCGTFQRPAEVIPNRKSPLNIGFNVQHRRGYSGVKFRFSFHGTYELPVKLSTNELTNAFNCSVPFYDKFRQHLDCNLETECVHGEDEASCPYSRGACKPGFLNAGSRCYKYVSVRKTMTWYDAAVVCQKLGLTLASMPTLKQLDAFRDNILRFAPTPFKVMIGLQTSSSSMPAMYREVWQWSNKIMVYYVHVSEKVFKPMCISLAALSRDVSPTSCVLYEHIQYIFCVSDTYSTLNNKVLEIYLPPLEVNPTFGIKKSIRFVRCSEGHMMHDFLSCDHVSQCGVELGLKSCVTYSSVKRNTTVTRLKTQMYICDSQSQTIHYTQVCDNQAQCFDTSDESFCIYQQCAEKQCQNGQCVSAAQWCDGMAHCSDKSDESCYQFVTESDKPPISSTSRMHVVVFDGYGKYRYVPKGTEFPGCPPTHFLCADRQLCIPVYLRCNGVYDCSDKEDENKCDDVTCPGYYRCRGTTVCVHNDHVCDGVFQCPQQDDELLCQLTCPGNCRCQGLAFVCPRPFPVQNYSDLRYLDASHSGLTPDRLFHVHYLIRLSLASCTLYDLPVFHLPNLRFLDLAGNMLANINMQVFFNASNLKYLTLSANPLTKLIAPKSSVLLEHFRTLDLSHTKLRHLESETLYNIRKVKSLNLSHGCSMVIGQNAFGSLTQIETLDLRGTELKEYPVKMLQSMSSLREIFSDVYKLCCQDILPGQLQLQNCHTVSDEISSCEDLLRSDINRTFLWITCLVALIGNVGSFHYRIYTRRGKSKNSFNVFITHLNVADFLMGLFLAMVGSADLWYRGTYLWHDDQWKTSTACKAAGFCSLLSSEMSAFIICFVTLDRFLAIHFPFSQLHFRSTSTHVVCGLSWVLGAAIAAVPLLPLTSHWDFYSQTDICIPLPITRTNFKGRMYSYGIMIVLNFLLFLLIAVGQLFIYISIRSSSVATDQRNARQATIARRLLTVVMSDFLCWFPIGLLGLMAANGVSIPGEINVAMAIFVLPLNSALNPFLYTFNLVKEKHRKASEQRLLKLLQLRYSSL